MSGHGVETGGFGYFWQLILAMVPGFIETFTGGSGGGGHH